ncbi:MAG: hypothetical protein GQ549_08390 [Gammaproteobacteria bacterium]|nr:hypothetical protein [Gammaproteobacteria bacterium]
MTSLMLIPALLSITACQAMHSSDPSSMFFNIPSESTLSLNKDLEITSENTHALIQAGKSITKKERNEYDINCRLDFKKFGPRTVKPETFIINRTEDGSEWFSQPTIKRFYTEVYLSSEKDTDIIKLECQTWGDGIDRNFTVTEMQQALGDLLTFDFAINKSDK